MEPNCFFDGRVFIARPENQGQNRDTLRQLQDQVIEFVTGQELRQGAAGAYLFLDLSVLPMINSGLVGAIGAAMLEDKVRCIYLCGMRQAVLSVAERFGLVSKNGPTMPHATPEIRQNLGKIKAAKSLAAGLLELIPERA